MDQQNNQLAVLIGNGVSIAANKDLYIPNLTREIRKRFEQIDPAREAPDRVLARLAQRGRETSDPYKDFEAMIGPLDQQKENLHDLRGLAELVGSESKAVRSAIRTIDTFVMGLRRLGVGHALDIIAQKSKATEERCAVVEAFLSSAVNAVTGNVTVGNLNYDALGMAALLRGTSDLCDMAKGYGEAAFDLLGKGHRLVGMPLRTSLNFPVRRVRLVHPHGSLTWLRNPETGIVYKFDIGSLRHMNYWANWRDGKTEWEPQVVLTNQSAKSDLVEQQPFKLAYDALYNRLVTADRWLIAGYSFRDECVNDLLADAWQEHKSVPEIMVVTKGDSLMEADVLQAIVHRSDVDPDPWEFLEICRCGVDEAMNCASWQRWAGLSQAA